MTTPDYKLFADLLVMFKDCEYCEPCREELPYCVGETDDDIEVYLVDGDCIKRDHDADYVEGANSEEADWIPENTCYVDWNLRSEQWPFVAAHEITEMRLMKDGMSYAKAHDIANEVEMQLRSEYSEASKAEEESEPYDNPSEEKEEKKTYKPTGRGGSIRVMIKSKPSSY